MSVKTFPFDSTTEDVRTLNAVDQRKMYADVLGDRLVEAFSFVRAAGSMVLFTYSGVVFVNGAYAAFTNESLDLTNTSTTATLVVARVDATMRTTTIAVVDAANKLDGDFVIGGASYSPVNGWSIVQNAVTGYIDGADVVNGSITTEKLGPGIIQSDTGWVPLQLNTSAGAGFNATWGTEWTPKYRKVGNLVQIVGAITPNSTRVIDATLQKIATLPASIRPAVAVSSPQQGGGRRVWTIRANGSDLTAEKLRYDNTDYLSATAGGEVMQFCLAYFV